jgi:uncharacterized protein (TIGR02646 family)
MPRVVRKQRPPALTDYKKYKPYLRRDFGRRCAYCHIPESRYGTPGNYAVDHFRPKSVPEFSKLVCRYSNLFYACRDCNLYKGSTWPSKAERTLGCRFLNPCAIDPAGQWIVAEDGTLTPGTPAAQYMVEQLRLNRESLRDWRRDKEELTIRMHDIGRVIASAKTGDEHFVKVLKPLLKRLSDQLEEEYGDFWH